MVTRYYCFPNMLIDANRVLRFFQKEDHLVIYHHVGCWFPGDDSMAMVYLSKLPAGSAMGGLF